MWATTRQLREFQHHCPNLPVAPGRRLLHSYFEDEPSGVQREGCTPVTHSQAPCCPPHAVLAQGGNPAPTGPRHCLHVCCSRWLHGGSWPLPSVSSCECRVSNRPCPRPLPSVSSRECRVSDWPCPRPLPSVSSRECRVSGRVLGLPLYPTHNVHSLYFC